MLAPKVSLIVLNWNGLEDTLACLQSLRSLDYPNYEVVVVDNASSDGSQAAIPADFPEVIFIETNENLGFVGGNNTGLEYALKNGASYVLLLNNDTEVAPDFLRRMVQAAQELPEAGMLGPTIYYYSQPDTIWSAGGSIDWKQGDSHMLGIGEKDQGQYGSQPRPVDFVTGCALLVKCELIEKIGVLDPRFYAYYEETEWCVRAARAGYKIYYVPTAHIWHKISLEAREASPRVQYYMTRNRLLFLRLTHASLQAWINTVLVEYGLRMISWTIKPRWRYKSPQRNAMLRALVDFARNRLGPASI